MYKQLDSCHNYEEAKLISLLNEGSQYAFQVIYDSHRDRIHRVAMRYLKSQVSAQEVIQDVFMKLWTEREKIKTDSPVEAWLFTVAKNNILNRVKKMAKEWKALSQYKITAQSEDNSLQEKIADNDYNLFLESALQSLSEKQLEVYRLAREENLSYIKIAEQLEISPLTVKTHMSRALKHLRLVVKKQWEMAS